MDKTLLFIVNPRAGKTKSSAPLFDAVATFGRAGYLVRVMLTQAAGDAARFAAQWGGGYDLVVCAGGDGTLNETLSGLMQLENRPPVGYLPNGSTNDFAASLRIPSSVQQAARAVVEGTPHPLDLGAHNDRYFSYVASFGAFTKASYSASQETKNALGHFAYILEGIKNLDSLRPYRCGVEADGESFDGDFIFGAVCNSTSLGGLVKLDPKRVHMDDGMFELILLRIMQVKATREINRKLSFLVPEGAAQAAEEEDLREEPEKEAPTTAKTPTEPPRAHCPSCGTWYQEALGKCPVCGRAHEKDES